MNEKKIVVPGELLFDGRKKLRGNVYLRDGKIYSSVVGLLSESEESVSVIPLNGPYVPKEGDGILAVVKHEIVAGYFLDYNSVSELFLSKSGIKKELSVGDLVFARVANVDSMDSVSIDNVNILPAGRLYSASAVKVPRLIGKNDSMLNNFKEYTKANIVVGKNGWVWYLAKDPLLLESAFDLVVNNSQKSNLTNFVKDFLEKRVM